MICSFGSADMAFHILALKSMQIPSNALPRDILITVGSGKSTTSSFSSTPKKKASSSAVTTATAAPKPVERPSVASRLFWKRAKTDLGADSLANYKANRSSATSVQGISYHSIKLLTFNHRLH